MISGKVWGEFSFFMRFLPFHAHVMLVGFLIQFIAGVALWMFPRLRGGVFTPSWVGYLIWFFLNSGTALRVFEPFPKFLHLALLGGVFQLLGILIFVGALWVRVRSPV